MVTFLDTILKALKATANNEQQKTFAAFSISLNNMDVITMLQELYKYCLINGDFKLAEEFRDMGQVRVPRRALMSAGGRWRGTTFD